MPSVPVASTSIASLDSADRAQSRGEELANSASHGVGFLAALIGTPFMLHEVSQRADGQYLAGAAAFAVSMMLLYLASSLYHALPVGTSKRIFRIIEHSAIYILIAGTYTPISIGVLGGTLGWTLLVVIWGLACIGIGMKVWQRWSHPVVSVPIYLAMGWLILVAINPLYNHFSLTGLSWLVAGGVSYTLGVGFFLTDSRLRYGHFVWHLFVLAGTGCHFIAILEYAR